MNANEIFTKWPSRGVILIAALAAVPQTSAVAGLTPAYAATPAKADQLSLDDHGVSLRLTSSRRRDGRINSAAPTNAAPRVAIPATVGPDAPDIFGSVALAAGRTPQDAKWRSVAAFVPSARDGPWSAVLAKARSQSQRQQLATVNAWVNHAISYTSDASNYGVADYWGTARESLTRGRGDCKDYAIAKMELLRALGVPADDLYLMLVRDIERRQDHAILAVRQSGRFFILDSGFDGVADAEYVRAYRPILTFSGARRWVHGFRRAQGVVVASATPVADALP
jgi:predicted transglutaminase-like cysteine proteinase